MNILITGSAGYIGSYFVNQLQNEHKIFYYDLKDTQSHDIRDYAQLEQVFQNNDIDLVIHTAAQKYVDLAEKYPLETITTNINGTFNVFDLCDKYHVHTCVFLSSDKATNPNNIYGMTKQVAENFLQYFAKKSTTRYLALRLCNVYGSAGSVVEIFQRYITNKEEIKITDVRMKRYFMSIDQVFQLLMSAIKWGQSGDTFLYKIKKPTLILDIAQSLCDQNHVPFKYTVIGNRGNEKLIETYSVKHCVKVYKNIYKERKKK